MQSKTTNSSKDNSSRPLGVVHKISQPVVKNNNEQNLLANSALPKGVNTTTTGSCHCGATCFRCRTNKPSQSLRDKSSSHLSSIGNLSMQKALLDHTVQTKTNVSQANDPLEREADTVAAQVMASTRGKPVDINSISQLKSSSDQVATKKEHTHRDGGDTHNSIKSITTGAGNTLPGTTRNFFEARMGHDFRHVRVHHDDNAASANRALQAQAFTTGRDIYFSPGRYAPHTEQGKELLAHELTHVVQQGLRPSGHTVQRREEAPSEQEGLNDETVACPSEERLDEIETNYRSMIADARARDANVAADNLEYFLTGGGGTRTLSSAWLRGFSAVTSAEERNEDRFEDSLSDLAPQMSHGGTTTHDDYWDAQLTASMFTELFYASGTSTITSTGSFRLSRIEDIVNIGGNVQHHWHDPYDWHAGLSASVPGHGSVSDTDGLIMQSCRGASPFEMESDWTRYLSGNIEVNDYWFDDKSLSWA